MSLETATKRLWVSALGLFLIAAALVLLFFGYHLFGKVPVSTDISISHIQFFAVRYDGSAPLWNPHVGLGLSLADDLQFAAYYPLRWPFFVLPWIDWLNPYYVAHYFIAFFGMFGLMRAAGLSRVASLGGGVAYLFGGYMMAYVIAITIFSAAAWLPWLLWGALTRRSYGAPLSALALTMIIWIGAPHLMIYGGIGFVLALVFRLLTDRDQAPGSLVRDVGRRGAFFALALAAGMGNLLPGLLQVTRSVRTEADPLTNLANSVVWAELAAIFFGGTGGIVYPEFNDKVVYIGGAGLTLALLGLIVRDPSTTAVRRAGLALTLAGVGFALGKTIGWQYIQPYVPGLNLLAGPGRALVLTAAGLAILIGLGLEAVVRASLRRRLVAAVAAALIAGVVLATHFGPFSVEVWSMDLRRWVMHPATVVGRAFTRVDLLLTLIPALAAVLAAPRLGRVARPLLLALLVLQFLHFSPRVRPRAENKGFFDPPGPVAWLMMKHDLPPFRVSGIDPLQAHDMEWDSRYMFTFLAPNSSTLFGLEEIGMYNPLLDAHYRDFIRSSSGQAPFNDPMRNLDPARPDPELFHKLNVRYLIGHPADRRVTHVPQAVTPSHPAAQVPDWEERDESPVESWGFVSFVYGNAELAKGEPVAELVVQAGGRVYQYPVLYGVHTAHLSESDERLRAFDLPVHMAWHRYPGHPDAPPRVLDRSYRARIDFGRALAVEAVFWRLRREDVALQISSQAAGHAGVAGDAGSWRKRFDHPVAPVFEYLDAADRVSLFGAHRSSGERDVIAESGSEREFEIDWVEHLNTRSTFNVRSREGGLLVLRDGWHPAWRAYVDGSRQPVVRVDELFRGIEIPAGDHEIVFRFVPTLFYGLLIPSGLAALALAFLLFRAVGRRPGEAAEERASEV